MARYGLTSGSEGLVRDRSTAAHDLPLFQPPRAMTIPVNPALSAMVAP